MDKETFDKETAEIKRLESTPMASMSELEKTRHVQTIKDAYWRRRMATRTKEEVQNGVCAP